jgi:hypothetical protein
VDPLGRAHGNAEYVPIEKEEGGEGLVLGGGGNAPAGPGEVGEEVADGGGVEFAGVLKVVESDIPPHPGGVSGDGPGAVPPHPEEVAELVEEAGRGHGPILGSRRRRAASKSPTPYRIPTGATQLT